MWICPLCAEDYPENTNHSCNVISLGQRTTVVKNERNLVAIPKTVNLAKQMLAKSENGEVVGMLVIGVNFDGSTFSAWTGVFEKVVAVIGELEASKFEFIQDNVERRAR